MAVVPIIKIPDSRLHQKCEEITDFGTETQSIVQNLLDTLKDAKDPPGAGLAAPQVGVLKRICIVYRFNEQSRDGFDSAVETYVLINPIITKYSREKHLGWEACLSIPDTLGRIERSKKIKIEAFDEHGKLRKINASGFFARVIQHELDHLDGKLFTDKDRLIGNTITDKQFDQLMAEMYPVVG